MGKGFNNYMCKKFFHPASRDNLKRVWMAEQKADAYKKKQEELRVQYEKEQDLYNNKAMLSKESKDKISVNFMYEPPPGAKKEREREDDEPEYKFEWQRKFNAPREDYCKGDSEIRDQPFGIQVRNVRCIKCHKWGHINTDKECPLFKQASASQSTNSLDPLLLVQQMKDDGLAMKRSALDTQHHVPSEYQGMIPSDEEQPEVSQEDLLLLKSLSTKKKLKLLRKLEKMENGEYKPGSKKSKKSKKKKKTKDKGVKSNLEENGRRKKSSKKRDKKRDISESSSDSESSASSTMEVKNHSSTKKKIQSEKQEKDDLKYFQSKSSKDSSKNTQSDKKGRKCKDSDSESESPKSSKKVKHTKDGKKENLNGAPRDSHSDTSSDEKSSRTHRKRKHTDRDDSRHTVSKKERKK